MIEWRLNVVILLLDEVGILNDMYERWFFVFCWGILFDLSCFEFYEVLKFFVFDVGYFFGVMLVLVIGLVFGGLVILIEYIIYKYVEEVMNKILVFCLNMKWICFILDGLR